MHWKMFLRCSVKDWVAEKLRKVSVCPAADDDFICEGV